MKILAIDTSTKYLSLALAEGEKLISSFHREMEQKHCAMLIPMIDKLLKKSGVTLKDISYFVFSKGPGSFTGLRIGAASVKALSLATKKPIVGVPSLDVLAYNAKTKKKLIIPVIDARRGNVYASVYLSDGGRLKRIMRYSVLPVSELLKKIKLDALFLGDGITAYRKYIEDDFRHKAEFAPVKDWYPRATVLARLGLGLIKKKKFEDTKKFTPMYLYPKDVQCRHLK